MLPSRYDKGVATMNIEQLRTPEQDCALQYSIRDRGSAYKATALPKDLVIVSVCYRKGCHFVQWCSDWGINWEEKSVLRERKGATRGP